MFEEFRDTGEILFRAGLNDSHSGNISVRRGNSIFITSRAAMLSNLKKDDIIETSIDGDGEKDAAASRDILIHRALYKNTKAGAIIHTHGPSAMALSLTENKILPQDAKGQSLFPQGVSIVKIRQGADREEIARLAVVVLNQVPGAAAVKGYGCFVLAEDINSALEAATCLELSSKIWLVSKLIPQRQPQQAHHFEHRKRSAIPPSIGVMGRRSGVYDRRDNKR